MSKPGHQGLYSTKRRGNFTFLLSTTTQGSSGSAFPLLAKLLQKRNQGNHGHQVGITPAPPHTKLYWAGSLQDPSPRSSHRQEGWSPPFKILTLRGPSLQGSRVGWQCLIRICHYPLIVENPLTATCRHTPALERAMVAVSKVHPGPGYLQVSAVGVKAALSPSPPANTPIYTNKHTSELAQRSFSCHHCCTSCSVIQGAAGARVTQRDSPAPAEIS